MVRPGLSLRAGKCRSLTWLNLSHNRMSSMTFVSQLSKLTGEVTSQNTDAHLVCPLWWKLLFIC